MRTFIETALLCMVLAQAGTACVTSSSGSSDGNMDTDATALQVTWNLVEGAANAVTECPAATARIGAEPIDDGDDFLGDGDEIYTDFDCTSTTGTIDDIPPGIYLVWVEVLDETDEMVAQSGSQEIEIRAGESASLEYTLSLDHGSIGLQWRITDGAAPLTCAEAGAVGIWVVSTREDSGEKFYDSLDCIDGAGSTRGLPVGNYQVEISLLDERNLAIGQSVSLQASIDFGSDYEDLGEVELVIEN